ncbi:Flagellar biosynthesis protein FlhA [Alphaproteobacteria bacterium SO-S41]|nr:Flagellar biosynthesis protein FlhA [Alphaproteobacteria bacterium SO-S41]
MTDTTTPTTRSGGGQAADSILASLRGGELLLPFGILAILGVLLIPLPTVLLDAALALSITFSVLILMTVLFIRQPLEFSAFPTILVISTMLRLSLNMASTRLILSEGHNGTDAAGHVIEAFGSLLMQGNFVIGIIVFAILVIVNFVVITKGSGRIAEVSARFTLDAMPGKQMAIDADLSAGLIDEKDARVRRKKLEEESNFFGAMDGASKFVRGDAIAGLLITIINILGGLVIGVAQEGMPFGEAFQTYTLLTVGDGLVTQIPALVVSTAAGLMVSKAGIDGAADKAMFGQLSFYPQALGMASFMIGVMAFLPGIPTIIFLSISGVTGYAAFIAGQTRKKIAAAAAETVRADAVKPPVEEPISTALALDQLKIELGYGLLPLINDARGYRLTDQIKALRRQIAGDLGFVMPSIRILDNMQLDANEYRISVKEVEAGRGELMPGHLLVMDPRGAPIDLPGTQTKEPAFGLPAAWIDEDHREEASFRGFTIVDPATVLTTHLTEVLKEHMPELLSYAETKKLIDDLPADTKKLADDLIPQQVSLPTVQRVLQGLLAERVSIRDLPTILEGIAEMAGRSNTTMQMGEHVRARLARQLSRAASNGTGVMPLIALSPQWEQAFSESIIGQGEERQLAMAPSKLQEFIQTVRRQFDGAAFDGETPVLLTSPSVRPFVRSIIERFRPQTVVMSQAEVHPSAKLKSMGQV